MPLPTPHTIKKTLTLLVSGVVSVGILQYYSNSFAGDAPKLQENSVQFRFENYKTAEEAQTALLKLHPIGSDTNALVERFKTFGKYVSYKDEAKTQSEIVVRIKEKPSNNFIELVSTEWILTIQDKNNSIQNFQIEKHLTGL